MSDIAMRVLLTAQDSAGGIIQSLGSKLGGLNPVMGGIVTAGLAAGAALVGVGIAAVKTSADFQTTMTQTQALAGLTAQDAQMAQTAIMGMSTAIGQTPQQLADGLYYIASAGFNAKDSLTLLDLSARAAAVGNTQTEVTANALTATLSAYGMSADKATGIMDQMVASVSM